jgi:hypothetical protein
MKIFYLFLFITIPALASNWMPVSVIQSGGVSGYSLESECKKSGEQCIDVGDEPGIVSAGKVSLENDWGPMQLDEACDGESACQSLLESKQCPGALQKFISSDFTKVYCVELIGKKLIKDDAGWSQVKASKSAADQVEAMIAKGAKARIDCQRVLDLIGGFNLLSGKSSDQVGQMVSTFATAKQYLQDGRPGSAKSAIMAIPVDGVLVTQQMKDLAIGLLSDWEPAE